MFIEMLWSDPAYFVTWVLMVSFSVCVHELTHAYAAASQGDDTALRRGYGTLVPRVLMGFPSLIALALFGIAWGAVPVNHSRMRQSWSPAFVAASGPLSNLALATVSAFLLVLSGRFAPAAEPLALLFRIGAVANALLAILNLLPIPMFDGWEVWSLFIPTLKRIPAEHRNTVTWVAILALFMFAGRFLFGAAHGIARILVGVFGTLIP